MIDDLLKIFKEGGYPLLAFACSLVANWMQWRERQKVQSDLLRINEKQHDAQIDGIKILTEIVTKVDKCTRQ